MFVGILMAAVLLALPVIASITAPQHAYAFKQTNRNNNNQAGLINVNAQVGNVGVKNVCVVSSCK